MAFNDRLKEARIACGLTQEQLAQRIGVAKSTVTGYEKGNSEPNMLTVQKIMQELRIDANFLWQDEIDKTSQEIFSKQEIEHIQKYRTLDVYGKRQVDTVLSNEIERIKEQSLEIAEETIPYMYAKTEYLTGLSAGTGLFVFDDIPTQVIEVPEIYKNADFVIGVTGDSMEPRYFNGEKVAVQKVSTINIGDIGVFMHEGNGYIKEFGHNKLISLNKAYPDIDINETTVCIGKVLGKV